MIGTYNADGTPNAMNIGWNGQWSQNEIMIMMGNNHAMTENMGNRMWKKMRHITCGPIHYGYMPIGTAIDYAFNAGKNIKDSKEQLMSLYLLSLVC